MTMYILRGSIPFLLNEKWIFDEWKNWVSIWNEFNCPYIIKLKEENAIYSCTHKNEDLDYMLIEILYLKNPPGHISYANIKVYKKHKEIRAVLCICPKNSGVFYRTLTSISIAKKYCEKEWYLPRDSKWINGD